MFGPVFWSELTRTAGRRRHLLVRAFYSSLLLAVLWISYFSVFYDSHPNHSAGLAASRGQATIGQMAEFAHQFVGMYGSLQLVVALMVTVSVTAGTIAEERDRRTIEYLFVSHLSDSEIVLDKLLVRLLHVFCLLLAALPVLTLSMLFGGVGLSTLFELSVLTLGTVVGTASLCLYVSVTTRRSRDAILRSLLLIVAGLMVPGIVRQSIHRSSVAVPWWIDEALDQLCDMNPFHYFFQNLLPAARGAAAHRELLLQFAQNVSVASVLFLGLAIWQVRRAHLKSAARVGAAKRRPMRLFRPPQIGNSPLLWKELFAERFIQREHRWSNWIAPVGLALVAVAIALYYVLCRAGYRDLRPRDFLDGASAIQALIGCVFILLAGARGAISISHEREQSTWDTLLTTTLESHEIVLAKIAGSVFVLRGMLGVFLVVWWFECRLRPEEWWRGLGLLVTSLVLGYFLAAVGVLISQYMRSSTRAITAIMGIAVVLGGGYLMIAGPIAAFFFPFDGAAYTLAVSLVFLDTFWIWYRPDHHDHYFDPLAAYLFGLAFYSFASIAVTSAAINSFERVAREKGPRRFVIAARDRSASATAPQTPLEIPAWQANE